MTEGTDTNRREAYITGCDGTRLWYEAYGAGAPGRPWFVLCDGIGCDGYVWKYISQRYASGWNILHPHYRGHGRSDRPSDYARLSLQDVCEDIRIAMDDAGAGTGILFGHSMGVQVVFEFCRMFPERTAGLVPMNGSYGHPLDTFYDSTAMKRALPYLLKGASTLPGLTRAFWSTALSLDLAWHVSCLLEVNGALLKRDDFMPYLKNIARVDPVLFLTMGGHAQQHTAEDMLPSIRVPTLIVAGELDGFTPGWLSEKMHRLIPGSELLMIPRGTHTAPIELPELVELRLDKFLREHFA